MVVATLAFVAAIVAVNFLGQEFFPETDENKIYIGVQAPPGTNLDETYSRIRAIEDITSQLKEVKNTYITIGAGNNEVTEGQLLLLLTDQSQREISAQVLKDSVRTLANKVPGVKISVMTQPSEGGSSKPVEFSIRGADRNELVRLTHRVQDILRHEPGATDVDNTLEEGKPELAITVDRKLADDLGLNLAVLSRTIRTLVEGDDVTRYKEGNDEYDVRIRLQEKFRQSERDIGRIQIASGKDVPGQDVLLVPLDRVAKIERESSIGEYSRYDRQPEVRVNANVAQGYFSGTMTQEVQAAVDSLIQLPPGYSIQPVGEQEIMQESFQNIFRALILAVVFIYLLLASQYESFFDPFSIMFSLPLSLVGAIIGLIVTGSSLSIMSLIGIVMLMGLVTKNAILLIDFVKQRRRAGVDRTTAILDAGPIRLRPILMTTFATVFGMLPLALGLGPGAEIRAPMARAVIGGMISSTLLTLVVVPVVYSLIDDTVGWIGSQVRRAGAGTKKDFERDKQPSTTK
jgi:HAE1 family hydrophobic/amphiphilic exporter-1